MKRPAICLFVSVAIVGWAAAGNAKKASGNTASEPTDNAAGGGDSGDQNAAPADNGKPATANDTATGAARALAARAAIACAANTAGRLLPADGMVLLVSI